MKYCFEYNIMTMFPQKLLPKLQTLKNGCSQQIAEFKRQNLTLAIPATLIKRSRIYVLNITGPNTSHKPSSEPHELSATYCLWWEILSSLYYSQLEDHRWEPFGPLNPAAWSPHQWNKGFPEGIQRNRCMLWYGLDSPSYKIIYQSATPSKALISVGESYITSRIWNLEVN